MIERLLRALTTYRPILDLLKDLLTVAFAALALRFTWQGLSTWRRQLRGNADFDLARRLLLAVLKARDDIKFVRQGWFYQDEIEAAIREVTGSESDMPVLLTGEPIIKTGEDAAREIELAWNRRRRNALRSLSELEALTVEAEALLWGTVPRALYDELNMVYADIHVGVEMYLAIQDRLASANIARAALEADLDQCRKVVFRKTRPGQPADETDAPIDAIVERVKELVRPHMGGRTEGALALGPQRYMVAHRAPPRDESG